MARLSEQDLISRYFAPLAGPGGLGLLDDAALLAPPPGTELVLTADALVAGVHFFAEDPPEKIAAKALAVNLSDLAAKGADPLGFLLTLALPRDWTPDWLAAFARGLGEMAAQGDCPLLGGDTVATPGPLTLSITALGCGPRRQNGPANHRRTGRRALCLRDHRRRRSGSGLAQKPGHRGAKAGLGANSRRPSNARPWSTATCRRARA